MNFQEKIVEEARRWIGTPYRQQASACGAGADCLGLVRGVWRNLIGAEPETIPPYTDDWAEPTGEEVLLAGATPVPREVPILVPVELLLLFVLLWSCALGSGLLGLSGS